MSGVTSRSPELADRFGAFTERLFSAHGRGVALIVAQPAGLAEVRAGPSHGAEGE
jgi:hypothetical protein